MLQQKKRGGKDESNKEGRGVVGHEHSGSMAEKRKPCGDKRWVEQEGDV